MNTNAMNASASWRPARTMAGLLVLAGVMILAPALCGQTAPRRTQTLQLHRGWNAVFLEVIPTNTAPVRVFAGAPVSIVATFLGNDSSVQFIRDPATIGWKKEGWGVWYAPQRPDAFLTTLFAIAGNRSYLVHAERDFTWNVDGYIEVARTVWKADSYSFVGFTLDPVSPPTFEKFFAGSTAHRTSRIYRLVDDHWTPVTNPAGTVMRAGESFWVECKGTSDYQGPLRVRLPDGNSVSLGGRPEAPLLIANESRDPASVRLENVSDGSLGPTLPLAYSIQSITDSGPASVDFDLPALHALPTLEPGAKTSLRLKVRRDRMGSATGTTVLKVSNGAGALVWVPVTARREDLSASSQ